MNGHLKSDIDNMTIQQAFSFLEIAVKLKKIEQSELAQVCALAVWDQKSFNEYIDNLHKN